jgi:hypothetical protein
MGDWNLGMEWNGIFKRKMNKTGGKKMKRGASGFFSHLDYVALNFVNELLKSYKETVEAYFHHLLN